MATRIEELPASGVNDWIDAQENIEVIGVAGHSGENVIVTYKELYVPVTPEQTSRVHTQIW